MASNSRIGQWMDSVSEFLNGQQWFQELKQKWEELDPQSRNYLKLGGAGAVILGILLSAGNFVWSVHSLKRELADKSELLLTLSNANEEIRQLRDSNSAISAGGASSTDPWSGYFTQIVTTAGVPREGVTVSEEKKGTGSDQLREALMDVEVKKINVKQLVRLAFQIENGTRPVKLRHLLVDTKSDFTGYMDATFSVSAFSLAPPK